MFATLYLPNFYLQAALRHQPDVTRQPVALLDDEEAKAMIIQLNKSAEEAGVRSGMTASQGLARCLTLQIKTRVRAPETLLNAILLEFAHTLAPYVEATAPGVCTIEFTDTRKVVAKVSAVVDKLAELQIAAVAGIAPSPDTSFLAAHLAKPVLQIANAKEFLAPLPIETLTIG